MVLQSNPQPDDAARQAGYARRMKGYRTIAVVAIGLVITIEMLHARHPAQPAQVGAGQPAVSARPKALRLEDLSAFRLGKMVADYSALRQLQRQNRLHEGQQQRLQVVNAQIKAALAVLQDPVAIDQLDFDWHSPAFAAPAVEPLAQSLIRQHGQHTGAVFQLGVQLMTARWRATSFQDTMTAKSDSAAYATDADPGTNNNPQAILVALRSQTTAVLGPIDFVLYQPSVAVMDLVRSPDLVSEAMLLEFYRLDAAVETLLVQ